MSHEKDRFNCPTTDVKRDFRHMRDTRFMAHPYQSSPQPHPQAHHDPVVSINDTTPLANTSYLNSRLICDNHQPESPLSTEIHAEEIKLTDTIKLPENLENLPKADEFPTRRSRWNTNEEILALLLNFSKHEDWQSKDVVIRPESGSMLMYSRKKVRYRRDGYCWKKRKDGKTTREDHMKLKVQGVECIYGCYVHSAVLPTFHRRCYWLLQNPDIVLVHYLNVPYPDDSKLAALIPNIAFWTEKKEWTREELLLQLKPMYENPAFEGGKEIECEDLKLNRVNQVSSFIESMIAQLLEKQRYVRTALANSLECGCGNRKCLGASRCTRPIRRISTAKKQGKRTNLGMKLQEKRTSIIGERNVLKTTSIRKMNGLGANMENRLQMTRTNSTSSYYNEAMPINANANANTDTETGTHNQLPGQVETHQLEQLLRHSNPHQSNTSTSMIPRVAPPHQLHSKTHLSQLGQNGGNKDTMTNYTRPESYMQSVDLVNTDGRHYQPNYSCPLSEQYVPNNEIEITKEEKQEMEMEMEMEMEVGERTSTLMGYNGNGEESDFASDKYQSDTTDGSDCNSYSTIQHQASPIESYTSVEDADAYASSGDLLDDLMMAGSGCGYDYEAACIGTGDCVNTTDRSLYELVIQLTQKEKKSACSNSVLATCEKLQQYEMQNDQLNENYAPVFENNVPSLSDANANFLNACSRYSTICSSETANCTEHALGSDYTRVESSHLTNCSAEIDINFTNVSDEFSSSERTVSAHSTCMQEVHHVESACTIVELAPEWSYCEGGTKLLIVGPWYFPSEYAVLFDSYSVPATLVQAGVLKCYCPEHAVGLVSLQVASAGSIISNAVVFEYKKRASYDESQSYHNFCNIKAEQYNQYMYENDTLLKFILIHRIESIQDDAYSHGSSLVGLNKYESIREKATM